MTHGQDSTTATGSRHLSSLLFGRQTESTPRLLSDNRHAQGAIGSIARKIQAMIVIVGVVNVNVGVVGA